MSLTVLLILIRADARFCSFDPSAASLVSCFNSSYTLVGRYAEHRGSTLMCADVWVAHHAKYKTYTIGLAVAVSSFAAGNPLCAASSRSVMYGLDTAGDAVSFRRRRLAVACGGSFFGHRMGG